jgi:hypothetical protein
VWCSALLDCCDSEAKFPLHIHSMKPNPLTLVHTLCCAEAAKKAQRPFTPAMHAHTVLCMLTSYAVQRLLRRPCTLTVSNQKLKHWSTLCACAEAAKKAQWGSDSDEDGDRRGGGDDEPLRGGGGGAGGRWGVPVKVGGHTVGPGDGVCL